MAINRQCSSGLQAVATVASAIRNGYYEIGIGAGVESMTKHYGPQALNVDVSEQIMSHKPAADCLLPMGITSENVAEQFGVSVARNRTPSLTTRIERRPLLKLKVSLTRKLFL